MPVKPPIDPAQLFDQLDALGAVLVERGATDWPWLRLRCGKCGRTVEEVQGNPGNGNLVWRKTLTDNPGAPAIPGYSPSRPSTRRLVAMGDGPTSVGGRHRLECHKRCCDRTTRARTAYTVRMDALTIAYVRAVQAGAPDMALPL